MLIDVEMNKVRVKWYSGVGGATNYILERQLVDDKERRQWETVFEGASTWTTVKNLKSTVGYRFRVRSVNVKGAQSDPSLPTPPVVVTGKTRIPNGVRSVSEFNVECTGDVTPGDTILFTERVFETISGNALQPRRVKYTSGLSTQSVASFSASEREQLGQSQFVGERTIAARVLRTREAPRKRLGRAKAGKILVLEVLWCTMSTKDHDARKHILRSGSIENRSESQLFRFECFRKSWVEEPERWSAAEELDGI